MKREEPGQYFKPLYVIDSNSVFNFKNLGLYLNQNHHSLITYQPTLGLILLPTHAQSSYYDFYKHCSAPLLYTFSSAFIENVYMPSQSICMYIVTVSVQRGFSKPSSLSRFLSFITAGRAAYLLLVNFMTEQLLRNSHTL